MSRVDLERACAFCGLPLPKPWFGSQVDRAVGPWYCCFGCRFAAAAARAEGAEGQLNWTLARLGLAIFLSMNVMVFTMVLWTQDFAEAGAETSQGFGKLLHGLFRYLCLLFSLPVLFLLGAPLAESASISLRRRQFPMELLLLLGVLAAYIYSAVSVIRDEGAVYFEVGCVVLVLVTLGRWLEARGKLQTTSVLESLRKLLPDRVRRLNAEATQDVPLSEVRAGDRLLVLPGERIPCDGVVLEHPALVDEQILTGESTPRWKEAGAAVHSGTLITESSLRMEVAAPAAEGTLARFVALMRQALQAKSPYQRLADRASAIFLPVVIVLAVAAGAWHGFFVGVDQGILAGLAVLLIACPCALGIATPLATWIALGEAARARVVIRGGEALERLAGVKAVRFDKTGTLTTGTPTVRLAAVADGEERCKVLAAAAGLARSSNHAYSVAIHKCVSGLPELAANMTAGVRTLNGLGLTAPGANGEVLALGSQRLMDDLDLTWPAELAGQIEAARQSALAVVCVGWGGKVRGCFCLQEELRARAAETLDKLRALHLDVAVLTGDHKCRAASLQIALGVPVLGELLPEDKVKAIVEAQRRVGPTAMVGDGLNDSPALVQSDVGIALACGADITRDAASICLLGDELDRLPWLFELARRTVRTIRLNLFWAFAYNVVGVGLACLGLLNPILAALAMVLSSGFVITNSLRLRQVQQPEAAA